MNFPVSTKGKKIEKFLKGEYIPENKKILEKIMDREGFLKIADKFFEDNYERGEKPRLILATYNRVGDGKLNGRVEKPNYTLDVFSGNLNTKPSEKETEDSLQRIKNAMEQQLPYLKNSPLVVFYGGEGEHFNKALKTIADLDASSRLFDLKPEQKPKYFLFTCPCQREEKIKASLPFLKSGALEGLIPEEENEGKEESCGGFHSLQKIVEHIEKNFSGNPDSAN